MQERLTERHANKIRGVLSCFDRVVITGTISQICYADAMNAELRRRNFRVFDFPKFAEPLRDEIRDNAERLARENGLKIDFIRRRNSARRRRSRKSCGNDDASQRS